MSEYRTRDAVAAKLRTICDDLWVQDVTTPITDATRIREDLGFDSLDEVELIMAAEEAFGLDVIEEAEATEIKTFGQMVDLVCGRLGIGG